MGGRGEEGGECEVRTGPCGVMALITISLVHVYRAKLVWVWRLGYQGTGWDQVSWGKCWMSAWEVGI